jgi:hypothetical protein
MPKPDATGSVVFEASHQPSLRVDKFWVTPRSKVRSTRADATANSVGICSGASNFHGNKGL